MIDHHPAIDTSRTLVKAPVSHVTVLEDRALVRRVTSLQLEAGSHRLAIEGLSPVLQDVSLRASLSEGRVTDTRAERSIRILRSEKPEAIATLDAQLEQLGAELQRHRDDQHRAEQRLHVVYEMLTLGAKEIPEDAAWGTIDPTAWSKTFDELFQRGRALADDALDAWFAQQDVAHEAEQLEARRHIIDRIDQHLIARALIDLVLKEAASVELIVEYVVPNALWRPLHRAELHGETLTFCSRAAIWQNTGETWSNIELSLSTAKGSLGNEPPQLTDDLLTAQRKSEQVELEVREVSLQSIGPTPNASEPTSKAVDLPGVDDGGEVQDLKPTERVTIPDGGEPVFVDLETTTSPCKTRLVCFPEVDPTVHIAVNVQHTGQRPLLAGPVELVRDRGPVGRTSTVYVAPSAMMELGFGPNDNLRVTRTSTVRKEETDPVDHWQRRFTEVSLFLSNMGSEPEEVVFTERIPVSEVDHLVISVTEERTTSGWELDEANGFITWAHTLPAHGTSTLTLDWSFAVAPDILMKKNG